jgi:hypothetical protein
MVQGRAASRALAVKGGRLVIMGDDAMCGATSQAGNNPGWGAAGGGGGEMNHEITK